METFSALLAICAGNSPVSGEFPAQRPVTRSFDVLFDPALNKQLSKQLWGSWFETLSCSLWRHCNEYSGFSKRRVTQWSLFTRDPVEVLAWIINFIQLFTGHVITFPYWGSRETMSAKKKSPRKAFVLQHNGTRWRLHIYMNGVVIGRSNDVLLVWFTIYTGTILESWQTSMKWTKTKLFEFKPMHFVISKFCRWPMQNKYQWIRFSRIWDDFTTLCVWSPIYDFTWALQWPYW